MKCANCGGEFPDTIEVIAEDKDYTALLCDTCYNALLEIEHREALKLQLKNGHFSDGHTR